MIPTVDPVDLHVGERIRARRKLMGLSQAALGDCCGVTFQQVQKYERGSNRISASMMFRAAAALDCEPAHFFEGLSTEPAPLSDEQSSLQAWLRSAEAVQLARAMHTLPDHFRAAVLSVAQSLTHQHQVVA